MMLESVPPFSFIVTRGGGKPDDEAGIMPSGSEYTSRSAEDSWPIHGFKAPSILRCDQRKVHQHGVVRAKTNPK